MNVWHFLSKCYRRVPVPCSPPQSVSGVHTFFTFCVKWKIGKLTFFEFFLLLQLFFFVATPFDVIKTQIQVNRASTMAVESASHNTPTTLGTIRYIMGRGGGIKGLWRGVAPSLMMQVPGTGLYYSSYENLRNFFDQNLSSRKEWNPLFAGCLSRVFAGTVTSPLEFFRTAIQANLSTTTTTNTTKNHSRSSPSMMSFVRMVWNRQVSPWTGLSITLMRDVPFSAIYWYSYERFRYLFIDMYGSDYLIASSFFGGAASGMIAALSTNPLDVIKSEIQAHGLNGNGSIGRKTLWQTTKRLYVEDGLYSFTRGWAPRIAKVAPACGIMISTFELCKSYFLRSQTPSD